MLGISLYQGRFMSFDRLTGSGRNMAKSTRALFTARFVPGIVSADSSLLN
ncbi:hypothetical protein GCM10007928_52470 [Sulfitobacter porphyrae]|nr:hypothetical protein GCM10007928_52470 [Sulfitobacter porphyrae]